MELVIDVDEHDDGTALVRIEGELDAHTAPQLDFELAHLNLQGRTRMLVDLGEVPLIDSTGLGALVTARNRCVEAGGSFELANPRPIVVKVIEITGLQDVLPVRQP